MGKKPTVFLGAGEIHFTVRSDSNGKMRTIETTLEHIAHEVADEYRLSVT
jgi:metal-dependent amidase/aminoacylase/carboxypeptidase family protein